MALEIIEKIIEEENKASAAKADAVAKARELVENAEADGKAALEAMRQEQAARGREMLQSAEAEAARRSDEIMKTAQEESKSLQRPADLLDKAADYVVERILNG